MAERRIVVAGGGAAGFFAAIACKEGNPELHVTIFEATAHPLAKVRISGGGRCNVTNGCLDPRLLVENYPRGSREMLGPFTRWGPRETIAWFESRGAGLKTEPDGRVFPITDESATIVGCLSRACTDAGVEVVPRCGVRSVDRNGNGFLVTLADGEPVATERVLIATGGNRGSAGLAIAASFGHAIEQPVPSLFTFHCDDPLLKGLEGLAVSGVRASVPKTGLQCTGPLLVTHWGLSGPAILKLSAWGARHFHTAGYRFPLHVRWVQESTPDTTAGVLAGYRSVHPRRQTSNANPFGLPSRIWERLVVRAGINAGSTWSGVSNASIRELSLVLCATKFWISGKSLNKEEFVTCGGVRLREIDFRTMESRLQPGLHFAGEVLDVDGVTGGFNFQSAWTTGWLAGRAMAGREVE